MLFLSRAIIDGIQAGSCRAAGWRRRCGQAAGLLGGDLVIVLLWGAGLGLGLALGYWLLVVGEGTYLGRPAVRLIYQIGAPYYDDVRAGLCADDTRLLLPLLASALADCVAPRALDVATGTGRVPLLLCQLPGFRGPAVGLDLTPAMLARARAKSDALQTGGRLAWCEGDADNLPWPDASFDLVTCLEALEFFPHPRRALAEMARVLRPGCTLVVSKYPDFWARMLPGKGLTRIGMEQVLRCYGLTQIDIYPWQPGYYELVVAVKRHSE